MSQRIMSVGGGKTAKAIFTTLQICILAITAVPFTPHDVAYAAPSTDYIVPLDVEMNEDNGASFDLSDLLGSAYTNGGLLPDYLTSAVGFCVSDATTPATWDGSTTTTSENLCTTPETFTIPADTTTIRITAYGTNSTDSDLARDDDYIQITATVDLDPNSIGNDTYSGFYSFPYVVDRNIRPVYAFSQVPLGSPSNTSVPATNKLSNRRQLWC